MDKPQFEALEKNKMRNLVLGILFDVIGSASFTLPVLGELSDVIWAPVSGVLMLWMYKGKPAKIGGIFSFLEEIFPITDIIPTFTLMWIYTYLLAPESKGKEDKNQL